MSVPGALFCELSNFLAASNPQSFQGEEKHKNIICCAANSMSHKSYNKAAEGIIIDVLLGKVEFQQFEKEKHPSDSTDLNIRYIY